MRAGQTLPDTLGAMAPQSRRASLQDRQRPRELFNPPEEEGWPWMDVGSLGLQLCQQVPPLLPVHLPKKLLNAMNINFVVIYFAGYSAMRYSSEKANLYFSGRNKKKYVSGGDKISEKINEVKGLNL